MKYGLSLALDGSTYAGSVALLRENVVIAEKQLADVEKPGRSGREELFMPMVADCLRDGQVAPLDLDRVICGAGPGSFTSLRIAASIAKGIAVGASIPLLSVSSLALIVADAGKEGRWMAVLPAMRGEVYAALFEMKDGVLLEIAGPRIIAEIEVRKEAADAEALLVGPAVVRGQNPHARAVSSMLESIVSGGECDIDTWEPQYGRLAEAQVKWEAAHGRKLSASA
jgi:tRNA threonylcarbamoyladenosine biosynthesis protein TsaB